MRRKRVEREERNKKPSRPRLCCLLGSHMAVAEWRRALREEKGRVSKMEVLVLDISAIPGSVVIVGRHCSFQVLFAS